MDLLDWRLLLIVAVFGAGWAIARVDMEQVVSRARGVPQWIMNGISNLLQGERLAAANDFIKAGQPLTSNNAELHFAAGELYRMQGDYESAIRVHKEILNNQDLNQATHERARYELGLDYQQGGFLDLAEQCFTQLEKTQYANESLRHLFNIHLYSKAWQRAIADEERFAKDDISAELRRHVIAQLYCEWALEVDSGEKAKLLDKAISHNPDCGRAWIIKIEDAIANEDKVAATNALENIKRIPVVIPVCASLLMQTYKFLDKIDEGADWLMQVFNRDPSLLMFEKIYEAIAEVKGHQSMHDFVLNAMNKLQGKEVVAKWLETKRWSVGEEQQQEYVAPIRALGDTRASFTCHKCNFEAKSHYWQCPVCLEWESLLPKNKKRNNA